MATIHVYNISKPFAYRDLRSIQAFHGIFASLNEKHVERHWFLLHSIEE